MFSPLKKDQNQEPWVFILNPVCKKLFHRQAVALNQRAATQVATDYLVSLLRSLYYVTYRHEHARLILQRRLLNDGPNKHSLEKSALPT